MSDSTPPFDPSLPARLRAREPAAWRLAFQRLWPVARRAAALALTERTEIEDAASAALADLAEQERLPANWSELEALTVVIARRRAISFLRRRAAAKRGVGETLPLGAWTSEPSVPAVASATLELLELLDQLGEPRRRIVVEHFLEGRSSDEIGERLGLNPATVRSHLLRALQTLRRNDPSP